MLGFFLSAIDRLAARPAGGIAVITAPAPVLPVDPRILEGAPRDGLLLWDAPMLEAGGRRWALVGRGDAARLDAVGHERFEVTRREADALFARVDEIRHEGAAGAPAPRLFGGLAFRPEAERAAPWSAFADASFALPRWLYGTDGEEAFLRLALGPGDAIDRAEIEAVLASIEAAAELAALRAPEARGAQVERTSAADWTAMIDDALARIRARELEKVVPATLCRVTASDDLDVAAALAQIRAAYPECARFAFQRGEATFVGASPEKLVARRGATATADGLAGSIARARDPESDQAKKAALLASDKDRREHRVVVEAIRAALAPFAGALDVPEVPALRTLRNVHHLWTPITATLARPTHVLDLARALHPTPAVCGTPREAAIAWIAAHEPAPRGWYAGAVGWFDAAGDGAFAVAIRSGVLERGRAWLYAGAGIVEGSDPGAEYAETRVKQSPMLAALGLLP